MKNGRTLTPIPEILSEEEREKQALWGCKPPSEWAIRRREYDRSLKGLLHRRYRDMKSRIAGKPQYGDRWKGLELLPLVDFIRWSLYDVDSDYPKLYEEWSTGLKITDNGVSYYARLSDPYDTLLSPSIDRIDSAYGYVIGNMQWLTRTEHMKRSAAARINGRFKV